MIRKSFVLYGIIWTLSIRLYWANIICQAPIYQTSMRHNIYYLWKHLEANPYLNSIVAADLPDEVFINSTGRPSSRLNKQYIHKA